jgi:(+)-trans-carveol dehydrogenase
MENSLTSGRVAGKVALVTGAGRGQGRAHAATLAEEGADILALDICGEIESVPYPLADSEDLEETAELVRRHGRRVVTAAVDIRDEEGMTSAVAAGVAELGSLDIVVANAGIASFGQLGELGRQAWDEMIAVNLTGAWITVKVSLPHLPDGASIVITSSVGGLKGMANVGHYIAAKHGVVGLMRTLAHELGPRMIRVNTVHPTQVSTEMIFNDSACELFRPDLEHPTPEDIEQPSQDLHLLPIPWVTPEDVAKAVLFLASEDARYITGITLPVDAGAGAR